jgi:hypothetical protein
MEPHGLACLEVVVVVVGLWPVYLCIIPIFVYGIAEAVVLKAANLNKFSFKTFCNKHQKEKFQTSFFFPSSGA